MRRSLPVAALIVAAFLFWPVSILAGGKATGDPAFPNVRVEDALAFRTVAGLASDSSTLAESVSDPAIYSDHRFGVPLSVSEAAVVLSQIASQNDLLPTAEAATHLPDFAATYFSGATLHVVTTGAPARAAAALRSLRPAGARVVFEQSNVDHQTLVGTEQAILQDADLSALVVTPTTVAIDPVAVRVEVTYQRTDPIEQAREIVAHKYGQLAVVLTADGPIVSLACNSRDDCGTKGGLGARHSSPSVTCTTGFLATQSGFHKILTAGHCIEDSGGIPNGYPWKNYMGTLTWGYNSDWQYDALEDLGTFYSGITYPYNQYFAGGTTDIRTIRSSERIYAQMPVGLYECRSGHTSGWDCGTIHRANISATYDGIIHYGLWEVTPGSGYGDSGSGYVALESNPAYVIPLGILSAGIVGGSYTYYYPAIDANTLFGLYVCISAPC